MASAIVTVWNYVSRKNGFLNKGGVFMAQAARIMEILQEMIHIDSETNTPKERQIELYLQQFFSGMDVISGLIHVPNDRCERSVVYGLIRGRPIARSFL